MAAVNIQFWISL